MIGTAIIVVVVVDTTVVKRGNGIRRRLRCRSFQSFHVVISFDFFVTDLGQERICANKMRLNFCRAAAAAAAALDVSVC